MCAFPHNFANKVLSRCCLELRQQVIPTACVTHLFIQDGIILVYDICDRESFNHVDEWLNEVNRLSVAHLHMPAFGLVCRFWQGYVNENTCKILIGNKCDMTAERQVSTEEAKKKAEERPSDHCSSSALGRIALF